MIYLKPICSGKRVFKCCKFNALSYFTDLIKYLENFKNCLKLKTQIDFSWFIEVLIQREHSSMGLYKDLISGQVSIERIKQPKKYVNSSVCWSKYNVFFLYHWNLFLWWFYLLVKFLLPIEQQQHIVSQFPFSCYWCLNCDLCGCIFWAFPPLVKLSFTKGSVPHYPPDIFLRYGQLCIPDTQ